MKEARWVIQSNLIQENDLKEIQNTCSDMGVEFQEVKIIPFSNELPNINLDDKVNIYYGSTTFMDNIYEQLDKPIGLFYNHETFSMENYMDKWGERMLNYEALILTVEQALNRKYYPFSDDWVFVRPDGDGKEFDGQVMKYQEVEPYLNRHLQYISKMNLQTKVIVGPAYNIHKEWRNYIVNGEIVSSSLYRENFKLRKSNIDIPESMLEYVNERIKEYQPHDNFVMDIASMHDGTYYIIECGCLNSVGFYKANISEIIKKITKYIENDR